MPACFAYASVGTYAAFLERLSRSVARARRRPLLATVAVGGLVLVAALLLSVRRAAPGTRPSDVSATIGAAVQATVQSRQGAPVGTPSVVLDESFEAHPSGWPDEPDGTAWYAAGSYCLEPREAGMFVAIDAPTTDAFHDGTVSARFRKTGGPSGGGYGIIVDDQGPEVHDGIYQGGQFVVLEVGDDGTFGAWQRADDHWIDLKPWTPSGAVRPGADPNVLTVRADGRQLTFLVNDTQVVQLATDLPPGRIGVFAGGDGNQVALERFVATQSGAGALRPKTEATPGASSGTLHQVAAASPTTLGAVQLQRQLQRQLDAAWSQSRWSEVQNLLDRLQAVAPTAVDFADKRYAAHVAAGQTLLDGGNQVAAAAEFGKAQALDPSRGEATTALKALTPTPTPLPSLPQADQPLPVFVGAVLDDVDEYWMLSFDRQGGGRTYTPATRHWYDRRMQTACGLAGPGVLGSFYCTRDAGLYLDTQFLQHVRDSSRFGDFPVAYVVAHEVGHRVQDLLGINKVAAYIAFGQTFSREIELQADCLAGLWSKSATSRNRAAPDDITQALTLAWSLGDPTSLSQRSAMAHGTPDDRAGAFLAGYNGSPASCGIGQVG